MKMKKCNKRIASKVPGMADGGSPSPHMLGMGMARTAAGELGRRRSVIDSAVDSATGAAPSPVARPAIAGGLSARRDNAMPPAHMLAAQRRGLKDGGTPKRKPNGGEVKGPGGPTDDKAGIYALSNTEYVLPGDTVEAMGGAETLDQIRDATHTFVDEKNRPDGVQGLANGTDDKKPWKSEFAKDNIPTLGQAVFGNRPASAPGVAENIGAGARAVVDGAGNAGEAAGQAARNLVSTGQDALSIANNLPGAIAAPIANAVDSVGARIRTGYNRSTTGDKFAGREFVGKPLFDGSAQAAPAPAAQPDMGAQLRAKNDAILNGDNRGKIDQAKISAGDRAFMERGGAQAAPAAGTQGMPSVPTIGKVNVSRQPNGVMSFSGKDQVDGYAGAAAGQLKGGGSSGAVTPADYQAAVQRAEKDKAGVVSMAATYASQGDREGAARMAAGDPAAAAAAEQAFQQRELRIAAMSGNKQAALMLNNMGDNETARLRIASDLAPKPETAYDKERTRGAKADNDRAAVSDSLIDQYMNAPDEKARNTALERLNALGGKNSADKYITIDVDTGQKDAAGDPIYAKAPFNTRTGQVVSTSGAGPQGGTAAPTSRAEYDTLAPGAVYTGPDGIQYTKGK